MFDTHVNLHGEQFQDDIDDVIARARETGVTHMLAICDRIDNLSNIQAIARDNSDIWCSVGVHPHYADDFDSLTADQLVELSQDTKVVAIGETGLDFHYGYSSSDAQVNCLREHIAASRKTELPIILHTREADKLMGDILEEEFEFGAFLPLLHCYTGGVSLL